MIDAVKFDNISPQEHFILKDEESWEDTLIAECEIGREEGRQKDQQHVEAIVRTLIREGVTTQFITGTTGTPQAEIEKLRQS